MDTTNIIAVIILTATGLLIFFGTRGRLFNKPALKAKSGPSVITTAGTSGGAAAATTPPLPTPPPIPAPAPVASVRSYGWIWWLIIIIAIVFVGRLIWYEGRNVRSTYSPPQATAPKKELRQHMEKHGLSFIGGDEISNEGGFIGVQKGGRAFFATHTLPWFRDAVYHIVVKLKQKSTSDIFIKINGQWTKSLVHPGSPNFTAVVFFEASEMGSPNYFNASGINNIEVWSLGNDDMAIQCVSIEIFR